ncbi:MAG: large subunit ribosomal protein [Chloroflexota bacterium]|nr:large subunit ribosomal protein [Chloroflexota bacterium]
MKVMLLKDVYNLGRAGEVKKVADGYARNFLIPQKLAVPASTGALRQIEKIQAAASKQRELLNEEMSGVAEQIKALELVFKAKVGETGKLYGSVTQQAIIDAVNEKLNTNLDRHQVESQPLREVGEHMVRVRLTFDLIPEVKVIVESDEEKKENKAADRKAAEEVVEQTEAVIEEAVEQLEELEEEVVETEDSESPAEEEA